MSADLARLRAVLETSGYPPAKRGALYRIATVVNEAHRWEWYQTNAAFADDIGAHRVTVARWLRDFVADGWLVVVERSFGGRNRPSRYRWAHRETVASGSQTVASGYGQGVQESYKTRGESMTLFDDDEFVQWRPSASRIAHAKSRFSLTDDEIERIIDEVNLQPISGSKAYRQWSYLVPRFGQARWRRGERPRVIDNPRPPVPAYEPTDVADTLSPEALAERVRSEATKIDRRHANSD